MGERKVLVRYIPPDFDPSIIPRFKRDRSKAAEVRMMLPFSMRCSTCGEYMGRGKKFNSRKEECVGEAYMGIRRFRFMIKCSVCSAQISFKTDPKNSDYECEWGATRNYEVWKDNEEAVAKDTEATAEEERLDSMRALENRTLDSKTEMDILDALDETMAINRRHERVDTDALLSTIEARGAEAVRAAERAEEDAELERFRQRRRQHLQSSAAAAPAAGSAVEVGEEVEGDAVESSSSAVSIGSKVKPEGLAGLLAQQQQQRSGPSSTASGGFTASTATGGAAAAAAAVGGGVGLGGVRGGAAVVVVKKRRIGEASSAGAVNSSAGNGAGNSSASVSNKTPTTTTTTATADTTSAPTATSSTAASSSNSSGVAPALGGLFGSYGSGSDSD